MHNNNYCLLVSITLWEEASTGICEIKYRGKLGQQSNNLLFYQHKICDIEQTDSKKWWRQIRCLTGKDIRQDRSHQFLDDSCPNTLAMAIKVNSFSISLTDHFTPIELSAAPLQDVPPELVVTESEEFKALLLVKTGKAVGPDFIPNKILNEFALEMRPVVKDIFISSISKGFILDLLKASFVSPYPKVLPPTSIESESQTNCINMYPCKVMVQDGFVRDRLVKSVSRELCILENIFVGYPCKKEKFSKQTFYTI